MAVAALALAGCGFGASSPSDPRDLGEQQAAARHIEIEVADLETGLPCRVVDRPNATSRNILWRAEFEEDFCRRKAEETRLLLQDRGWACRRQNADERQDLVQATTTRSDERSHLVAAWRCVEGLPPIERTVAVHPPVPSAKPDRPERRSASWDDELLQEAVEGDLATIGREVIDDETAIDTALGDLNDDGSDDAIVILTRDADRGPSHRMLMAYLRSGDAYNLVDVWVLDAPAAGAQGDLTLAIENGRVRLETCCEAKQDPTVLILADRKLAYAQGG